MCRVADELLDEVECNTYDTRQFLHISVFVINYKCSIYTDLCVSLCDKFVLFENIEDIYRRKYTLNENKRTVWTNVACNC